MSDDLPTYLARRLDEVVTRFDRLDEKIDVKLGEYGTRIATTEADLRNALLRISELASNVKAAQSEATTGRRWAITTALAVLALLLPLVAFVINGGG